MGKRSVGIIRSRIQAMEFSFFQLREEGAII
jgi:hypothetical protein